jgi:hypothetical protein
VSRDQIPELLETRFGLPGFAVNGDGRVVAAADEARAARGSA